MSDDLLVVALEASADLHGAAVLRELRALRPGLQAFGAGGPLLRAQGCETLVRAEELSVMGIAEVLPALPRIFRALRRLRRAAEERRPRVALLIDSPDFNLRLARKLRRLGIQVAYFIGPSVWAWRTYRVRQIARDVARMLVILPFEAEFYARHGVEAVYVGNPLADEWRRLPALPAPWDDEPVHPSSTALVRSTPEPAPDRAAIRSACQFETNKPVVALLPGSRRQEVRRLWPILLAAATLIRRERPDVEFCVPIAPTLAQGFETIFRPLIGSDLGVRTAIGAGATARVLAAADVAVVASGTATLEAALASIPTVIVYRMSWLSWLIGRLLVRLRHVGLPNLLAGRGVIPELLQSACTPENIAAEVRRLLAPGPDRDAQVDAMRRIRAELTPAGAPGAARRVAEEVAALLGEAK